MKALADENMWPIASSWPPASWSTGPSGILMDRHGLAEAEAFRPRQKSAMDGRRKLGEVAQSVIDGELTP